jgi:hypothetical protein
LTSFWCLQVEKLRSFVLRDRGTKWRWWENLFSKNCFIISVVWIKISQIDNPELTLSSVLMNDQHVKVYLHVSCLLSSVVKINSNTYTNSNSDMPPLFRGSACFNSWTTMQQAMRWMISYSLVVWSFPFHERNCCKNVYICPIETFCKSISNCITVYVIVSPRLNIKYTSKRITIRIFLSGRVLIPVTVFLT